MTTSGRSIVSSLALLAVLLTAAARADVVMSVQSTTVTAGTFGNTVEVWLTNNDPTPTLDIGGFSFAVIAPVGSGITFTGVDDVTTTPYIFAGNSLGFLSNSSFPSTDADGNDLSLIPGPLGGSTTVALGRLTFDVAADAQGVVMFDLVGAPNSGLADGLGGDISFVTQSGAITILPQSNVVPEPSSYVVFGVAASVLALWHCRRRGAARVQRRSQQVAG